MTKGVRNGLIAAGAAMLALIAAVYASALPFLLMNEPWRQVGEVKSPDGRYVAQYGVMPQGATGWSANQVRLAPAHGLFREPEVVAAYSDFSTDADRTVAHRDGPPPPVWTSAGLLITFENYWPDPSKDYALRKTEWRGVKIHYRDTVRR